MTIDLASVEQAPQAPLHGGYVTFGGFGLSFCGGQIAQCGFDVGAREPRRDCGGSVRIADNGRAVSGEKGEPVPTGHVFLPCLACAGDDETVADAHGADGIDDTGRAGDLDSNGHRRIHSSDGQQTISADRKGPRTSCRYALAAPAAASLPSGVAP